MNYRHIYHAGNFADVLKHTLLVCLLNALKKKPTPFCFLDTHAGIGLYPLQSTETQKQQEYQQGISTFYGQTVKHAILKQFLELITACNSNELNYYPGSPWIAEKVCRAQDRLIFCELHPADYHALKSNLKTTKHIHMTNGYQAAKAFIPPAEKRGLVLIDPPFESTTEFTDIINTLTHFKKHWRMGMTMVWYPIKWAHPIDRFYSSIKKLEIPHLIVEITLNAPKNNGMQSCGVLIINPPWKMKEDLHLLMPELCSHLDAVWRLK